MELTIMQQTGQDSGKTRAMGSIVNFKNLLEELDLKLLHGHKTLSSPVYYEKGSWQLRHTECLQISYHLVTRPRLT